MVESGPKEELRVIVINCGVNVFIIIVQNSLPWGAIERVLESRVYLWERGEERCVFFLHLLPHLLNKSIQFLYSVEC